MTKERVVSGRRKAVSTGRNDTSTTAAKRSAASPVKAKRSAESPVKASSPREARRQQRIDTSREQILDMAEQLFAERGYHETGLKDVATRCEFSVGSIYSFFDNKDSLYEQVLMRRSADLKAIQNSIPDHIAADERLVRLAENRIKHAREYPAWGALTAEISRFTRTRGTDIPEVWIQFGRSSQRYLADVIKKGQAEGSLRPGSPVALARLYNAVVSSFILVDAMSQMGDHAEAWPSDTEEFLDFVHDTFSSGPSHNPRMMVEDD
ncbi:TetR/AcrR family transcriptional regulator [Rhodococcus koreensis]